MALFWYSDLFLLEDFNKTATANDDVFVHSYVNQDHKTNEQRSKSDDPNTPTIHSTEKCSEKTHHVLMGGLSFVRSRYF